MQSTLSILDEADIGHLLDSSVYAKSHSGEVIARKVLYVKSILIGILSGIVCPLVSIILVIIIVGAQDRQGTPGVEVGVDIRSVMGRPLLGIIALVGFGVGFYREYRRASS